MILVPKSSGFLFEKVNNLLSHRYMPKKIYDKWIYLVDAWSGDTYEMME